MDQAIDTLLELYEDTEVGEVAHLGGVLAANGVLHLDVLPRILLELLQAKAHLALVAVEGEDDGLYLVAYLQEVLSGTQVLAPRHLGDVDQTLDARLDFDEGTVVGHDDNLALDMVADLEVLVEAIPWVRGELLQTEGNALLLLVEVEDNDIDLLVELHHLVRIAHAAPREVGDVDESVNTTEINEDAVGRDVLDSTLQNLTLLQVRDDLLALSLQLGLDEGLVRDDNVAELLVDLDDLELHRLADEDVVVAYGVNVNLAAGEEGLDAKYINDHATLRAALDVALDDLVTLHGLVDVVPALLKTSLLVRKLQLTVLVLLALDIDLYLIADLEIGVVAELRCGNDTIALVADVDNDFLLVDGDNGTLNHLVLLNLVQGLVVGLGQFAFAIASLGTALKLVPVEVVQRLYVLVINHK